MPKQFYSVRTRRALAMLTAFCCLWLSTIGSLCHTDCDDAGGVCPSTQSVSATHGNYVVSLSADAHPISQSPSHGCLVCEWQANSVSTALALYTMPMETRSIPHVNTGCPLYRSLLVFGSPARAPPVA